MDTITAWAKKCITKGWKSLCKLSYDGRRVSEFEDKKEEIERMIDEKTYGSCKELYDDLCKKFEIKAGQDALRKFCKKNEM